MLSLVHLVALHPPLLCLRWASQCTRSPTTTLTPPTTTPISKWMLSLIMPQSEATALTTPVKKRFWTAPFSPVSADADGAGLLGWSSSCDVSPPVQQKGVKGRQAYELTKYQKMKAILAEGQVFFRSEYKNRHYQGFQRDQVATKGAPT